VSAPSLEIVFVNVNLNLHNCAVKIFVKCPVDGVKNNSSMKVDFVCFVLLQGMVETITLFMFFQTSDSSTVNNNLEQITENKARLSLFFTLAPDISEKASIILE